MATPTSFRLGDVRGDLGELRVVTGAGEQPLTPLEAELLGFLLANRGRTVTRERLLTEVWRYSPKTVTRAVDNTISRLRRKIEADPSAPRWLVSTRGGGYRLQAEPTEPAPLGNLPAPRDSFVGRARELLALGESFGADRLVTLLGPGGTGKTRLAYEFARRNAARFPGGSWVADLTQAVEADGVLRTVAQAVHVPLRPGDATLQLATALAYRGPMLLVLDNCDQVTDAVAQLVTVCLDRAPELVVLATSREPLRLRGEQRRPLEPLTVPNRETLEAVADSEAADLFVQRSKAARPSFALTADNAPELARLVRLLDGLPLAVELAAARTDRHSLEDLASGLQARIDDLASDERDRPDRHRSLVAALDWSWERLTSTEQAALSRLVVFEGGCTLEAAGAVLAVDGLEEVLGALVDKSLVRRWASPTSGEDRFGLFVTVRGWAREKLGDGTAAEERHGGYYAGLDPRTVTAEELDNLLAATRSAVARQDPGQAVPLCVAVWEILRLTGPVTTAGAVARQVLAMTSLSTAQRAATQAVVGMVADRVGDLETATASFQAVVAAAREVGDRRSEGRALGDLGAVDAKRGRLAEAEAGYRAAIAIAAEIGDRSLEARAKGSLAPLHEGRGDTATAIALHEEAIAIHRELGERRMEGHASCQLGALCGHHGRLEQAAALHQDAIDAARETDDRWSEAIALGNLGHVVWELDDRPRALALLEQALAGHRAVGDRRSEAFVRGTLGVAHAEEGHPEEAYVHLGFALANARETGDALRLGSWLGWIGWIQALRGERDEAERCFVEGEAILSGLPNLPGLAELYLLRARAEHHQGDLRRAHQSLDLGRRTTKEAGMEPTSVLFHRIAEVERLLGL